MHRSTYYFVPVLLHLTLILLPSLRQHFRERLDTCALILFFCIRRTCLSARGAWTLGVCCRKLDSV